MLDGCPAMAAETLHQTILDFLNSASSAKTRPEVCRCGARMEFQNATFFFDGEAWEVELAVCPECNLVN